MFEPHQRPREDGEAWWFVVRAGEVLVVEVEAGVGIPRGVTAPVDLADLADVAVHVLGTLEGRQALAVELPEAAEVPGNLVPLRQLHGTVPDLHWNVAGRAHQIVSWDRDHRFCGRCGGPTAPAALERARTCAGCGHMAFPRLSPATIMRVTRGEHDEEILLARNRMFPGGFFSVLAGFVEPGESLEECVAREVLEETAISVRDVTYYASQPWPFPHQLMVGFTARYESGDVVLQEDELSEAGWFPVDELPPCPRGGISISGWMIDAWVREQQARAGA